MPSKEEKNLARLRFIEHVEKLDLDLLSALFDRNSIRIHLTTGQLFIEDLAIDQYTLNNIIVYTDLVLMSTRIFKYYSVDGVWGKQALVNFLKESDHWLKRGSVNDSITPNELVYIISDYYDKPKNLAPLLLAQLKVGIPLLSGMDYQLNLYFMKCKALGGLDLDPKVTHIYKVCLRESAVKMFSLTYGENSLVRLLETTSVSLVLVLESHNTYCGLELDKSFYIGTIEMDFQNSKVLISEVGSRGKDELDIVRSITPTLADELMLLSTLQPYSGQPGE